MRTINLLEKNHSMVGNNQQGDIWILFLPCSLCCHNFRPYSSFFSDLALDVKGCSDVYASFDKYVAVEMLEGDNKYQSEKHGLQVSLTRYLIPRAIKNLILSFFCTD
jgi:ubiquitin C-terminal hydrolase